MLACMTGPRRAWLAAPLLLVLAGAGACGDEATQAGEAPGAPSAAPSAGPSGDAAAVPAGTPACAEVWLPGGTLPQDYRGCEQDGALVAADGLACSSGQRIVRFDDRWYAVPGGPVQEATSPLDDDPDYLADVRSCRG